MMNRKHLYILAAAGLIWWLAKRGAFAKPKALPVYAAPATQRERLEQQADFALQTGYAP